MTSISELIREREDSSKYRQHTRLALGTLIAEGVTKCEKVTEADLNRWASAIRNAFSNVFDEVWSIVIFTGEADSCWWAHLWFDVHLGGTEYAVVGSKHESSDEASDWAGKFEDFFTKEFACQRWVPECDPIVESLRLKYMDMFGREIHVVVLRGGLAGGDFIGKAFSHSDHNAWIICE
jgi:hypothetical protein